MMSNEKGHTQKKKKKQFPVHTQTVKFSFLKIFTMETKILSDLKICLHLDERPNCKRKVTACVWARTK